MARMNSVLGQILARRPRLCLRTFDADLRLRGFMTTVAEKGRPLEAIMRQTGHKTESVLREQPGQRARVMRAGPSVRPRAS
jgi:hypothetical protein